MTGSVGGGPLVLGGAIGKFGNHRDGSHWRDRLREVAAQALAQSGLDARDIDALVVGNGCDAVSLQINPAPVVASDIGLTHCSAMRVEGGGASCALALRAGVLHVLSGLARRCARGRLRRHGQPAQGSRHTSAVFTLSFDTDVEGLAGANAASLYALSMVGHMRRHGSTERQMATVAVKNRGNARFNPVAHKPMAISIDDVMRSPPVSTPYKRFDCSLLSDGAAAIVLCAPGAAPHARGARVRISGCGCATDSARLGDRPQPHRFEAKATAARTAYAMEGLATPAQDIDVAEVYDAFSGAELQSLEALGLVAEGAGGAAAAAGEFDREGRLAVNLSGGLMGQGGSPGAVGIAQAVTVARLLCGEYHPGARPDRCPRCGVATLCVVHVLERVG